MRVFWGGSSRGDDWLLSDTQPINPSCWQANEPLSLLVCTSSNPLIPSLISCINYSVLCGSPVSFSLHWSPAQILLMQGGWERAEKERQEGSHYKSGFETTHLILKAKLLRWQLKCSVSPVYSPKWYCLLQSLNIMSWACKYMSTPYDHPPKRNSKGSKKEQMPSCRFLFQQGLQLSLSVMSRLSWNVCPVMYFLLLASLLRQQFSQHHAEVTGSFASLPVEKAAAPCLLWELSVCTKLSTTGPDLRLQGRGALVAVLAQMRDFVQRHQITWASG